MAEISLAVIVPVYNEEQVLHDHLQRFIDLEADELIFVDGGSKDQTKAFIEQIGLRCLSSKPGRANQMNAGAVVVKSDILVFIHIDTLVSKSDLALVKALFDQSVIVGGRFDVSLSGSHPAFRVIEFMMNQRSRFTKVSTGDQVQFVRRTVFESIGGFAKMPLLEDVEFSKRLKKIGRIACLPEKVMTSSRRWESHGIIRTVWLMWKIRLLYWLGVSPEKLVVLYRDAR